nr:hypothetical protein [Tanacetum cinerariifolium]
MHPGKEGGRHKGNQVTEAQQVSYVKAISAKEAEEKENLEKVEKAILVKEVDKIVERDEEERSSSKGHHTQKQDEQNNEEEEEKNVKKQETTRGIRSTKGTLSSTQKVQECKAPSSTKQQDFDQWSKVQEINDDEPISEEGNLNEPPMFLWNKDLFYLKHGNIKAKKYGLSLHKIYANPFPEDDLKELLTIWLERSTIKSDPEEVYLNLKIIEVIRVKNEQGYGPDLMEEIVVKRVNDKAYIFSKSDYKYLNKNKIEYMNLLCLKREVDHKNRLLNSLIVFIRGCLIWERVHDYRLGIESYQIKISLTGPTFVIPCIETLEPYTITSNPFIGIVYENNKKRRVMNIDELLKRSSSKGHHTQKQDEQNNEEEEEKNVKKQETTRGIRSTKGTLSSTQKVQECKAPSSTKQQDFDQWSKVQEINDDEPISEEGNLNEPPMFLWNKDLFYLKHGNIKAKKYGLSLHKIYANPFPEDDLKELLTIWLERSTIKSDPEEVYLNLKIIEVIRVKNEQGYGPDLMEEIVVKRVNDKAYIFSKSDYKYLNKNKIEYMNLLCLKREVDHKNRLLNSLIVFIRGCLIWERVHDYRLGIESYQIKISLTGPTFVIPCIETLEPYTITSNPFIGIVYENNKKRRVMNIDELLK